MSKEYPGCKVLSLYPQHLILPSLPNYLLRIATKANLNNADEELRQELLQRLIDCQLMGVNMQVLYNGDPSRLPLRELPHGSWSEVFILYKAFVRSKQEPAASRSTFFQEASMWHSCLRFHQKTQHAHCVVCSRYRAALRACKDIWLIYKIFSNMVFMLAQINFCWGKNRNSGLQIGSPIER